MASNKKPPQKPKPPLPNEDPSLMLKASSNRHEISGDVEIKDGDFVVGNIITRYIIYIFQAKSKLILITCLSLTIGLLVVLYFLVRYLGS